MNKWFVIGLAVVCAIIAGMFGAAEFVLDNFTLIK